MWGKGPLVRAAADDALAAADDPTAGAILPAGDGDDGAIVRAGDGDDGTVVPADAGDDTAIVDGKPWTAAQSWRRWGFWMSLRRPAGLCG